ncbi:MAG: succinate dehydrogenase/fumarate reductase iron-sulfur subunit, partial [Chthoniobacterales bacterium]|nr:succinate dehydrogenase/fumarate reductase iron-sulfur subunit [Chthoniobacterales bacterium]
MNFHLKVWRQKDANSPGRLEDYEARNIPPDASFLEMLDIVNEDLISKGIEPIVFDHDCREGICGMCSLTINGIPHGPSTGTTCQLYMRKFEDGSTIYIEPFRAGPFPVIRDLSVNRSALDRIIQAGGFISERTGSAPDANSIPIPKTIADEAMDAAACIGCGACAAACPNSSAMLFVAAKVSHLNLLPQGKPEKDRRVLSMVEQMDKEGFGGCSNFYQCEAVCPAHIPAS